MEAQRWGARSKVQPEVIPRTRSKSKPSPRLSTERSPIEPTKKEAKDPNEGQERLETHRPPPRTCARQDRSDPVEIARNGRIAKASPRPAGQEPAVQQGRPLPVRCIRERGYPGIKAKKRAEQGRG
ncbi:uncharacterized protein A4U43_C01F17540 [Asparagus officinalis]|uniref:Uncharacterized protein n=1 Tax=Asparagus officinalis TaxID=4686 RepID=A0A5P1FUT0_ASPOF|nr:uncharacterized protein A4U43_C01F17540 [Asparagus officinalis]